MAHDLTQADFETLLPKDVDLRPSIAEQVRKFLKSDDHKGPKDTDIAKAERFLLAVERKGYATKIRKGGGRPTEDSTLYEAMLKNWGRKKKDTEEPDPTGDKKFARGVFYYFFRDVPNHVYFTDIAKQIWKPHELIFQRLYYAKFHDDPKAPSFSKVCARYSAERHIIRREFDKIWIGAPVGPSPKVHLGPVRIAFGDEEDLNRLSLQEPADQNYVTDGMPDVFKALDWRSRLSGFHGRSEDASRLKAWAQDETAKQGELYKLKIALVSGPGGAGKTRLAADAVAELVHNHGWCGGFLGDASRTIDGNGTGIALIIDYPEERTKLVSDILKAAAQALRNGENYDRPIRLILVSRETRDAWDKILNEPATFIDEIRLDARPYLQLEDALSIVEDITIEYAERLGRKVSDCSGAESWLEPDAHRLPLNVVAASVHAVLDPDRAFKLNGTAVLMALAKWELRRVRYYSQRDLGDRDSLEKLLALSLLTQFGLAKETVFELGEKGICPGKSGDGLLEAVRTTPYWQAKNGAQPSHLTKLQPDRPAAIFCLTALTLDDPPPALPRWLIPAASQEADGFVDRLSRVSYDMGHVNPDASRNLEQECIAMLDLQPALIDQFGEMAYRHSPAFSAAFATEICRHLLAAALDDKERASLLNSQGIKLALQGRHEAALEAIEEAVVIFRELAETRPYVFLPDLAVSLNNKAIMLADLGLRQESLDVISEATKIYRQLEHERPGAFLPGLASSLHNEAVSRSYLGQWKTALTVIREAVSIRRRLVKVQPDAFLPDLAASIHHESYSLSDLGWHKMAMKVIAEAVDICRQLAKARPDAYLPKLAGSLNDQANRLCDLGQWEESLEVINEAVKIRRELVQARPEAFLPSLAASLNNQATSLSCLKKWKEALKCIEESVAIYGKLAHARPRAFAPEQAASLSNQANTLLDLGQPQTALIASAKAIAILRPFFLEAPAAYAAWMKPMLGLYDSLCKQTFTNPDVELLQPIVVMFRTIKDR